MNMGTGKAETVRLLREKGARFDIITNSGFSVLVAACANEDSDPNVVKDILQDLENDDNVKVNYRVQSSTIKWKILRGSAKLMMRVGAAKSALFRRIARGAGLTALHYAVRRGDLEVVKLLLRHGANPYVQNDLGMDAFKVCMEYGPFPKIHKAMWNSNCTSSDEGVG